jgi:ParB family chromosome partitioning protein
MDDDTAVIALVDSNLHRESLLPSEKAHAFKMKMEALSHQGKACGTGFHKSRDGVADDMTGRQVSSYIRLAELVPELLDMVDEGLMAIKPAVELSYLAPEAQRWALGQMEANCCTPSHAQTRRIRALHEQGQLTEREMGAIMAEDKPNQAEQLRLPLERLRGYFPKSYTPREMADTIVRLLEQWQRRRERQSRDAR